MVILGSGYIGTALARQALAMGEPVAALTRNAERAGELRALGASPVIVADIAAEDWHGLLDPAGAKIVNCVSPSGPGVEGYRHSFIQGAKSISRWLEQSAVSGHKPAREFVFTSSTGVYPQTNGEWVDETTPVEAKALSPAGQVLREAEAMFLALSPVQVQRAWVLRLGGLYGPHRHQLLDSLRAGGNSFPGGGGHWINLLYRDDAVDAIAACLGAAPEISGGVFNVVDDEPVLKRDLVTWLAARLGREPREIQFTEGKSPRAAHRESATGQSPHRRISNLRFKQTVGWHPSYPSYQMGYDKILALKNPSSGGK